jgi:thiol-disulfide isomerase/thioredoxin
MKKIFLALLLFAFAKTEAQTKRLAIGSSVPEAEFTSLINYEKPVLKLSDFRGKLIVLDFWGTGCSVCIKDFERMDSLQKRFAKNVQFILVTKNSRDSVLRFFKRFKKIRVPDIPLILGDTILSRWFPYRAVPLHVWINETGAVTAITEFYNTAKSTIEHFIQTGKANLPERKDVSDLDQSAPLIVEGGGRWFDHLEYFSYIMRQPRGIHEIRSIEPGHVIFGSSSAKQLFLEAFNLIRPGYFKYRNTFLEVADTYKFDYPEKVDEHFNDWVIRYRYYYELKLPAERVSETFPIMKQDLERYFGLTPAIEKRKIKVLSLQKQAGPDRLATKGGKMKSNLFTQKTDSMVVATNIPFNSLLQALVSACEGTQKEMELVDETRYQGNIDIELKHELLNFSNLPVLNKELDKYGLRVEEKWMEREVLVIKEKK